MHLSSTIPDADILAPLGEHEREEIIAEVSFSTPFVPESEGWTPEDRLAGRSRRLREMKDLVLGGGSTRFAAMDEGSGKYHYSNHPTYHASEIPSVVEHWNNQSDM